MFGIVLLGVLVCVIVVFLAVITVFVQVAYFNAPGKFRPFAEWEPPLATGDRLLAWAGRVSSAVAARQLALVRSQHATRRLTTELYAGTKHAMARSPYLEKPQSPCPNAHSRMIGVTAPEILTIVDTLHEERSPSVVRQVRSRAASNARTVASMDQSQYEQAHVSCPLIGSNGRCLIEGCRPLQCQGWRLRADGAAEKCHEVPLDEHVFNIALGVETGLTEGIQSHGLDGNVYELNHALVAALDTPHATESWAVGKPVFADCKRFTAENAG